VELSDFSFSAHRKDFDSTDFDCGDDDINEFLREDALLYQDQKIASTYLFTDKGKIAAFFSISNDCLKDLGEDRGYSNNIWNRFHRKTGIPNDKRIRKYPAVLIGRLGIDKQYQGNKLGNKLLDFIKGWIYLDHKPACRVLILDVYNKEKQLTFYAKNGFSILLNDDQQDVTRLMYFDMLYLSE
jgi:GNAT superfamily N-acetyltransferase